jgi:hypothetical protein
MRDRLSPANRLAQQYAHRLPLVATGDVHIIVLFEFFFS